MGCVIVNVAQIRGLSDLPTGIIHRGFSRRAGHGMSPRRSPHSGRSPKNRFGPTEDECVLRLLLGRGDDYRAASEPRTHGFPHLRVLQV